jgi:hypothetical protein
MNEAGDEVVPFIYDNSIVISEGMAAVRYNGKWGFISFNANINNIFTEVDETEWEDMYD